MSEVEEWGRIWGFPDYLVSNRGDVINERTGHVLRRTYNQKGIAKVTMYRSGTQTDRAVSKLVAETFLYKPNLSYNSVIVLDQDRDNLVAENLAWRPKWFAIRYNDQFEHPSTGFVVPIRDRETGEEFENGFHAAMTFGLLHTDIYMSWVQDTTVWPTGQKFEPIG